MAIDQCDWQHTVLDLLEHWHDADASVVGTDYQGREVFVEESGLVGHNLVREEEVKLQLIEVALDDEVIEAQGAVDTVILWGNLRVEQIEVADAQQRLVIGVDLTVSEKIVEFPAEH